MPIYPYRCEACGEVTEVWAKMSDPPPEACPACNGGPVRKAVARTAFHLKGGGWYAQGYGAGGGSSSSPASSGAGGSSDADSGSSDSGSSDGGSSDSGSAAATSTSTSDDT